ncbi:hypothetical protein BH10CYA1_BH10CYA1_54470 [soil metagenome]
MELTCNCKSDERVVGLLAKNIPDRYPELTKFGALNGWQLAADLDLFVVNVGSNQKFKGIADLANFLREILDEGRFNQLRSCWLIQGKPLNEQTSALIYSEPLNEFVGASSSRLSEILKNRRIESWFQPVISAKDGSIWGYECLMRSKADDGEMISPGEMLEWARQEKLTFMLDRVCREIHLENAGRLNPPPDLHFLINFLPTAIYQPEFCLKSSLAAAARSGLRASQVIFEVVETEKVTDREHLKRILDVYRASGFKVALDDMGSGYAGLALLGDLRPDLVKIDRELVAKCVESEFHKGICAAIINLSKQHGQTVLAEGVETAEEKAVMDELGIDLFQGYYFGRPKPLTEQFQAAVHASAH